MHLVIKKLIVLYVAALTPAFLWAAGDGAQDAGKIKVVSTFSILHDVVQNVGGAYINAKMIVGPNQDTHVYEPTPEVNKLLLDADVIFINGLGFETWLTRMIKATGYTGEQVVVSEKVKPRTLLDPFYGFEPVPDPHVWGDVANVIEWVRVIEAALCRLDPAHKADYVRNAAQYRKELQELDTWIRQQYHDLESMVCRVITAHDAFGYYGGAYDIVFLAPSGLSTDDEPSAAEMADLIRLIKKEGIKTIFVENISSQHLINQLASETGAQIGGTLYSDALSRSDEPAASYIQMMRHNTLMLRSSMQCRPK